MEGGAIMSAARTEPQDSLILRRIPYTFRRTSVRDRDLTAPPGAPSEGDRYIVATGGSGAWAGKDNQIAEWHAVGAAAAAWIFEDPWRGYTVWLEDEEVTVVWNGASWGKITTQKLVDGEKLYLSNTTESYLIYEGSKVKLYVNGNLEIEWG